VLPELGLYVYGNCILYGPSMDDCRHNSDTDERHTDRLWYTSLIMIIYGYVYMLFALFICCFGIGFAYMYRSWSVYEVEEEVAVFGEQYGVDEMGRPKSRPKTVSRN